MDLRDGSKSKCQGGNDLGDQPVEVGVGGTFNVQVPATNIVKRLVVLGNVQRLPVKWSP